MLIEPKWGKFNRFQFNQNIKKQTASNAFGLSLCDILLDLVLPIVQRDDLFAKMDFAMITHMPEELGRESFTFFGVPGVVADLAKAQPQRDSPVFGSTTRLFFYFLEAVHRFFVPILKHAETVSMQLERMEAEIKKLPPNDFRKKIMEGHFELARSEFLLYRVALEDEERANGLNAVYQKLFAHLLAKHRGAILLPNHFLLDYIEVQTFLANIRKGYFGRFGSNHFGLYLSLLEELLSEHYRSPNPFIQAKFFDLLFTFNIMEKGRIVGLLKDHLGSQARLKAFLLAMVDFYSAIEFMGDVGGVAHTKYRYRFFITKFMLKALTLADYTAAFVEIRGAKEVSSFIGHLFTDLNYFLEEAFEKLKKIAKIQQEGVEGLTRQMGGLQVGGGGEETPSVEAEGLPQLTSSVKSLFKFGRAELRLIDMLSQVVPDVFSDPEWAAKIAQTLNYYAAKLCSRSYRAYRSQSIAEVGLKPLEFIRQLVLIYDRIGGSEVVRRAIINDDRSYSRDTLFDLGITAYNKKLVPADVLDRYETLINQLEAMRTEKDDLEAIMGEAPDEFNCALIFEVMRDPVLLPASKLTVERNAIRQHLTLNGPYDPFTKTPLTAEDLIPLPELQARIESWIADKRELYRQKFAGRGAQSSFKDAAGPQLEGELYQPSERIKEEEDFLGGFGKAHDK